MRSGSILGRVMNEESWEWNDEDALAELDDELDEGSLEPGDLDDDDVWDEGSDDY
jgi:hypothetical protein